MPASKRPKNKYTKSACARRAKGAKEEPSNLLCARALARAAGEGTCILKGRKRAPRCSSAQYNCNLAFRRRQKCARGCGGHQRRVSHVRARVSRPRATLPRSIKITAAAATQEASSLGEPRLACVYTCVHIYISSSLSLACAWKLRAIV